MLSIIYQDAEQFFDAHSEVEILVRPSHNLRGGQFVLHREIESCRKVLCVFDPEVRMEGLNFLKDYYYVWLLHLLYDNGFRSAVIPVIDADEMTIPMSKLLGSAAEGIASFSNCIEYDDFTIYLALGEPVIARLKEECLSPQNLIRYFRHVSPEPMLEALHNRKFDKGKYDRSELNNYKDNDDNKKIFEKAERMDSVMCAYAQATKWYQSYSDQFPEDKRSLSHISKILVNTGVIQSEQTIYNVLSYSGSPNAPKGTRVSKEVACAIAIVLHLNWKNTLEFLHECGVSLKYSETFDRIFKKIILLQQDSEFNSEQQAIEVFDCMLIDNNVAPISNHFIR